MQSNVAPVWLSATVWEVSNTGISSGSSHFQDRGECLQVLKDLTNTRDEELWITGYQKYIDISLFDIFYLWNDNK